MKKIISNFIALYLLLISINAGAQSGQENWLCYSETNIFFTHTPNLSILENRFETKINTHFASFQNEQALYGADLSFSPLKNISLKVGISSTNFNDDEISFDKNQYLVSNKSLYYAIGFYNKLSFKIFKNKEKKQQLYYNIFAGRQTGDYAKRFICIDQLTSSIHNPSSSIQMPNNYFIATSIKFLFFKYQFRVNVLDINSFAQSWNPGALFEQSINFVTSNDPLVLQHHHFRFELEGKLANIFAGYGFVNSLKKEIKSENSFLLYENILFKNNFNLGITINAHNFNKENITSVKLPRIKLPKTEK